VLSHDNTSSIEGTFKKMGGEKVADPDQILSVLDHNAPPTNSKLANDYQKIRDFVNSQGVSKFYDVGDGICHQIMSYHARPGMIIVGSDSHTCTAGAFNAFAAGIDRTETAGLWKQGETWFRVPETIKITLLGELKKPVASKDLALWIIGMLGSSGADYMSIEYHGQGVESLSISERMTLANLASEMGAKNAVFPCDGVLNEFYGEELKGGVWADEDAVYLKEIEIDLGEIFPVIACPHHVDNVKGVSEVAGTNINQALIGTCTNGRLDDLKIASDILKGKKLPQGFQLLVIPASKKIYTEAMKQGIIETLINSGANILAPSCGPCLGTGQGIPADGYNVISTANRNFLGRMGNKNSNIYLGSPATVAKSALYGAIADPREKKGIEAFPYKKEQSKTVMVAQEDDRYLNGIWDYTDVDNLNTDQMFAGNLTYNINSSEPDKIAPYLFKGFDDSFAERVQKGDVIIAGENFGCGSSREHPSVGLAFAGVRAVIVKSVSRIFFRSAINQGLLILVIPEAVEYYRKGDPAELDLENGIIKIKDRDFSFPALPPKLMEIIKAGGLVDWIKGA
ncbi:MAG TPA: aconitase/3-isopropylmalate dehydratase large subunit family protein, partial [Desulfobacteraceae bacterium]|nr:aconitase/3-isopropylmalate dehydratase large subunit family protein [Desulfobacteraceae bacterium]HPQ29893.1 aconitase/3-isopropylmalate dehydratase large subunit family protein [Desulfobacteraceae bacterium]